MPVSPSLLRILQVRALEEERRKLELDFSRQRLDELRQAVRAETKREGQGRRICVDGAVNGSIADKVAGLVTSRMATECMHLLQQQTAAAEVEVEQKLQTFLEGRIKRRQMEKLVDHAKEQESLETARIAQRELDDLPGRNRPKRRTGG